jgi:Protein of unknown function (DUF3433)
VSFLLYVFAAVAMDLTEPFAIKHTNGELLSLSRVSPATLEPHHPTSFSRRPANSFTTVSRPQLSHSGSKQSVAASEYYYSLNGSAGEELYPPATPPQRFHTPDDDDDLEPLHPQASHPEVKAAESRHQRGVSFDDTQIEKQLRRKPVPSFPVSPVSISEKGVSISEKEREYGSEQKSLQSDKRDTKMEPPSPSTTPGVDETPYIRFAIDQLTRDEEVRRGSRHYPGPVRDEDYIEEEYPVDRIVSDEGLGYLPEQRQSLYKQQRSRQPPSEQQRDTIQPAPPPPPKDDARQMALQKEMAAGPPPRHPLHHSAPAERLSSTSLRQYDVFVPYSPTTFTQQLLRLNFLPGILRPLWLGLFIFLCLLMLIGLTFCAIWSRSHNGLWDYVNFGDNRYFVFEYLPSIFGMVILLWLFQIEIAVQRISPFIGMASPSASSRASSSFLDLYPTQFLLPKLQHFRSGQPIIGACFFIFWLFLFTIPLLASSFNARFYGPAAAGVWRWVAVEGVIWTVVALYILLIIALILLAVHLWRTTTGLKWDPRSIADICSLLERANIVSDYNGTETFSTMQQFRQRLWNRSDRLGYWHTSRRPQDIFYGIGEEGGPTRRYSIEQGRIRERAPPGVVSSQSSIESIGGDAETPHTAGDYSIRADIRNAEIRRRYIPWFLSSSTILAWILIAIALFVAFLVVAFVNQTSTRGFLPQLPAAANEAGFSSANFLYSFLPSLLGFLLFLLWLPLDFAHRRLAPFAAMAASGRGTTAEKSLLLDYPYALPLSVSLSAATNRHWKVALLSFLSLLNISIPILSGGIFWAQWYPSTHEVRIAAHPSGLYALCFFLALYTISFFALLPGRKTVALPHDARCLAEIVSWLYMSPLLIDRAFSRCATKADLVARLIPAPTAEDDGLRHKRSFWASVTNIVAGPRRSASREDIEAGPSTDREKRRSTAPDSGVPSKARDRLGTSDQRILRQSKLDRIGGGEKLRYGFGVYLGRDGKEHLGIDRVKRGERDMVLFEDGNVKRKSWVGF